MYDPCMRSNKSYMILVWTEEVIYDPCMKSKFSYITLVWNPRNHRWNNRKTKKNTLEKMYDPCMISKKIISDPWMKPKNSYMTLVWNQWSFFSCMILVWALRNHTNYICPSMVTKNLFSFFAFIPTEVPYMVVLLLLKPTTFCLKCKESFENFCMILVWVLRNHTHHI